MNDVVIKAENLGKKYVIGHQAERGGYTALRDVLMQNARVLRWRRCPEGTEVEIQSSNPSNHFLPLHPSLFTFHAKCGRSKM